MAADEVYYLASSETGHYDPADHGRRGNLQIRLWSVLSAAERLRPAVSGDKCFGYLYIPRSADQRRDRNEFCRRPVPVSSRIYYDHGR